MDKTERQRHKTLANDAIIRTFGVEGDEAQLATALETCVDELGDIATECEHCKTCQSHGDFVDDSIPIDASEVMGVHRSLTASLKSLNDFHKRLFELLPESQLPNELAEIIEETESQIDELEACVIP